MTVRHYREASYGETVRAQTWISQFQRGVVSVRQVRLGTDQGPLASASQKWVHVDANTLKPARAPAALVQAFAVRETDDQVVAPDGGSAPIGPEHTLSFSPWFTSMDPLDHTNHPVYVDWCDETLARALNEGGVWPGELVPVAERVHFKAAASAHDRVRVLTRPTGFEGGHMTFGHEIRGEDDRLFAKAVTVRTLATHPERLATVFGLR